MNRKMKRYIAGAEKAAQKVSKAVGAGDLVEYAGAKIAKARVPKEQRKYIKSKATGKQALKSAAVLGATVGTGAAGLGRKAIAKTASRQLGKAVGAANKARYGVANVTKNGVKSGPKARGWKKVPKPRVSRNSSHAKRLRRGGFDKKK